MTSALPSRIAASVATPRLVGVEPLVVVREHPSNAEPGALDPREVSVLVLVPLAHDDLPVRVVYVGPRKLPALHPQLELRQVRASKMVRQIGGREPKRAVIRESHHLSISKRPAGSYAESALLSALTSALPAT